jgi:hypothetical protein
MKKILIKYRINVQTQYEFILINDAIQKLKPEDDPGKG